MPGHGQGRQPLTLEMRFLRKGEEEQTRCVMYNCDVNHLFCTHFCTCINRQPSILDTAASSMEEERRVGVGLSGAAPAPISTVPSPSEKKWEPQLFPRLVFPKHEYSWEPDLNVMVQDDL